MRKRYFGLRTKIAVSSILGILLVIILSTVAWSAYKTETARTVARISEVYLKEMTTQMNSHFATNMDSQFAQIKTMANSMSQLELESKESLGDFWTGFSGIMTSHMWPSSVTGEWPILRTV